MFWTISYQVKFNRIISFTFSRQYLSFPYSYQLPHQSYLSSPVQPPVVSVPSPAVYSFSHGSTGIESYQPSAVRQFSYDVAPLSGYGKEVLPLPYKSPKLKYHTTIEPQLILGPYSLPPTLEYTAPSRPAYQQAPHPYAHYDLNFIPSLRRPTEPMYPPFSPLKFRVNFAQPSTAAGFFPHGSSYNTISYSVPYSSKYKRDSNH